MPHPDNRHFNYRFDTFGQWHIIALFGLRPLSVAAEAAGDIEDIDADLLQLMRGQFAFFRVIPPSRISSAPKR